MTKVASIYSNRLSQSALKGIVGCDLKAHMMSNVDACVWMVDFVW